VVYTKSKINMRTYCNYLLFLVLFSLSHLLQAQEYGKASYYNDDFDGGKTFFGETYNRNAYTTAHKVHPLGTRLKVTRVDNNKSVIVPVNDRGPCIKGRIVDLSYAAAKSLGMIDDGVVDVKVEIVSMGTGPTDNRNLQATSAEEDGDPEEEQTASRGEAGAAARSASERRDVPRSYDNVAERSSSDERAQPTRRERNEEPEFGTRLATSYSSDALYQIRLEEVEKTGYAVQVASLSTYERAMRQVAALQKEDMDNIILKTTGSGQNMLYKIMVGPYIDRDDANAALRQLKRKKMSSFVTSLSNE